MIKLSCRKFSGTDPTVAVRFRIQATYNALYPLIYRPDVNVPDDGLIYPTDPLISQ